MCACKLKQTHNTNHMTRVKNNICVTYCIPINYMTNRILCNFIFAHFLYDLYIVSKINTVKTNNYSYIHIYEKQFSNKCIFVLFF